MVIPPSLIRYKKSIILFFYCANLKKFLLYWIKRSVKTLFIKIRRPEPNPDFPEQLKNKLILCFCIRRPKGRHCFFGNSQHHQALIQTQTVAIRTRMSFSGFERLNRSKAFSIWIEFYSLIGFDSSEYFGYIKYVCRIIQHIKKISPGFCRGSRSPFLFVRNL